MKRFLVCIFSNEKMLGDLMVSADHDFRVDFPSKVKDALVDGFCADSSNVPDFIVATTKKFISGHIAPNWLGEGMAGLNGNVYLTSDLISSRLWDFMFFRKIEVKLRGGGTFAKWYLVPRGEWFFPADPMMPWGSDFYKYLNFHISGRGT